MDKVTAFFKADEWGHAVTDDGRVLLAPFDGDYGRINVLATTREEEQQILVYSTFPSATAEERRAAMAELLMRLNWDLVIGGFEVDFKDGEVRYKTSLDIEGGELTDAMLRNLLYANVLTADRCRPAIIAVQGGASPADALRLLKT